MNKPALFFAGTTALFALSTVYLGWQLQQRDDVASTATAPVAQYASTAADTPATAARGASNAGAPVAATSAATGLANPAAAAPAAAGMSASGNGNSRRSILGPFASDFLRQYDDLSLRQTLLDNSRRGFESRYAALRDRLNLDPATFDQLMSLLAEESLEQQANYFRCVVDTGCDLEKVPTLRDRSDEFLALLGPDGHAQFNNYRDAMPEWESVVRLRGRLSESQYLGDSDAQRLQASLTEARRRFTADLKQQGARLQGWGDGSGMLWYAGDGTIEQQLASATQYSQSLRRHAAAFLNADQLRLFGQLQDEMLAAFGAYLHTAQSKND